MDTTALMIPQGNDVVVTARFPEIDDGTGMTSEFWFKTDKTTPDTDPSSVSVSSPVIPDPDNAGSTMSTFAFSSSNTGTPGAFWWRVDVIDVQDHRRTTDCGPLLVEAV